MLTNVIYGYIHMTHEQIFQHRTCAPDQCCTFVNQTARYGYTGSGRNGKSIRYLQTTGIPVYSRSPEDWYACSDSGSKDGLYRKAIAKADQKATTACKCFWANVKRDRHPGVRNFFVQCPQAWLKKGGLQDKLDCSIVLIVCQPRKFHKYIIFWFQTRLGPQVIQTIG